MWNIGEDLALEISKVFTANPDILEASVNVNFNSDRQYYCNTEGSQIVQNKPSAILAMNASIRADDKTPPPPLQNIFRIQSYETSEQRFASNRCDENVGSTD